MRIEDRLRIQSLQWLLTHSSSYPLAVAETNRLISAFLTEIPQLDNQHSDLFIHYSRIILKRILPFDLLVKGEEWLTKKHDDSMHRVKEKIIDMYDMERMQLRSEEGYGRGDEGSRRDMAVVARELTVAVEEEIVRERVQWSREVQVVALWREYLTALEDYKSFTAVLKQFHSAQDKLLG